jgi:hypothetical protein
MKTLSSPILGWYRTAANVDCSLEVNRTNESVSNNKMMSQRMTSGNSEPHQWAGVTTELSVSASEGTWKAGMAFYAAALLLIEV